MPEITLKKTSLSISLLLASTPLYAEEILINSRDDATVSLKPLVVKPEPMAELFLRDIRSITTFDESDIGEFQVERIEDIASYSPGLIGGSQTAGTETSLFIRGYRTNNGNVFVNGHQDNKRLFSRDLDTVEQVDIVKGHSSVLFGSGSPGGTIHYRTKQPKAQSSTTLKASVGSYQKRRVVLDSTGETGIQGLNYRFVAIGQNAESFIDNVGNDKEVLMGALAWNYQENSQIRFEIEYDRLQNPYSYGIVRMNEEVLYDKSYVDPRTESDRRYLRSSLYWQHALNDNWQVNTLLNYSMLSRNDIIMGFYYKLDEETLLGHWADSDNNFWQMSGKIELSGEFTLIGLAQQIILGIEYNESDNDLSRLRSTSFVLNALSPSFDREEPRNTAVDRSFHYRDKDKNIYLVDKVQLTNNLSATVGARYSQFYNENRLADAVTVDQNTISSILGLSWQWSKNGALYGSYAKSFEPNYGVSRDGHFFAPREAEQWEVGFHWLPNQTTSIQMAVYDLTQKNLLTRDPDDRDYSIPAGERRTLGFELEGSLELSHRHQLKASYSHMKNEVTEGFHGLLGKSASGIPRNMGSLLLHWQPSMIAGMDTHIGLIAIGKRYGDASNSFSLPGYGRIDVGLSYELKHVSFRLTVENLLDKRYVAAPFSEDDLYQGKRRDIVATVSYQL